MTQTRDFLGFGADTRLLTLIPRTVWRRHDTLYDDTTYCVAQTRDFIRFGADTRPCTKNSTIDALLFVFGAKSPSRAEPPHSRGFVITQRRTIVSSSPLDEWSALRIDLYLTTHNTTDIHAPGGIRTHNLSMLAAADLSPRPRATGTGIYAVLAFDIWVTFAIEIFRACFISRTI